MALFELEINYSKLHETVFETKLEFCNSKVSLKNVYNFKWNS